jgi:anti-sigma B factor antagonist
MGRIQGVAVSEEIQDVARFEVRQGDEPGIVASGELDVATVPELKAALSDLIDRNPGAPVWVDMEGVSFIDSSGLGVLVGALKRARQREGTVVVRNLSNAPRKVFEITGLLEIFGVE